MSTTTTKQTRRGSTLAALVQPMAEAAPAAPAPAPIETTTTAKLAQINVFVTADDHMRLRMLSTGTKTSMQKLAHEGLNLMLKQRGLPPLAPATAQRPSGRRGEQ